MVQIYPGFQNESSTYYAEAKLTAATETSEALVRVPGGAGAISFDVYGEAKRFSIYVTNSNYEDVISNKESVIWHETEYMNVTIDLFAVLSAVVGCYRIVSYQGSIDVKVRGK